MPKVTNIGKKVESFERLPDLHPGQSMDVPFHLGMKLWESDNFQVDWAEEELKDRDSEGKRAFVSYRGPVNPFDGYGLVTIQTLINFAKYGIHVSMQQPELKLKYFQNTLAHLEKHYPEALSIINRQDKFPTKWGLVHCIPPDIRHVKTPYRCLHTMWESTLLPTDFQGVNWDEYTKMADALIVPSSGQVDIFRNSGYARDIHVVPDLMELDAFPYMKRPKDRPIYRFFCWGRLSARKDPLTMLSCFAHAFQGKNDVQLIVKTRDNCLGVSPIPQVNDSRITVINDNWSVKQLQQALYDADAYVGMSHGEGWMVPPCNAASSGLPCITPDHSGCTDWADKRYFLTCGLDPKEPYTESPLGSRDGKPLMWWQQDRDQVISAMRWCYENRDAAYEMGAKASKFINRKFAPDVVMRKLVKVLDGLN